MKFVENTVTRLRLVSVPWFSAIFLSAVLYFLLRLGFSAVTQNVEPIALVALTGMIAATIFFISQFVVLAALELDRDQDTLWLQQWGLLGKRVVRKPLSHLRKAHVQTSQRRGEPMHRVLLALYDGSKGENLPIGASFFTGQRAKKTADIVNTWRMSGIAQ